MSGRVIISARTGEGFRLKRNPADAQRHALAILAHCPEGSTHAALTHNAGCTTAALNALIDQGLVRSRTAPMSNPPDLVVTRYWITDEGLRVLKKA